MDYQTFSPHSDFGSLVKCYWTLEVPTDAGAGRQRIIPDGCIEMIFTLGEDIKRYKAGDEFIIQPRAMVLGHTIEPFFIEPMGYVNTFAVRFYPYGFTSFVTTSLKDLANKETPIEILFGEKQAAGLAHKIVQATETNERIYIVEKFLLDRLKNEATIDHIVKSTVDLLCSSKGTMSVNSLLRDDLSRRQLERKFIKQVGLSPKQLGKVIRLQTALKMLLNQPSDSLTKIAYESEYYDQAHFIKDFKEFTGTNPKAFSGNDHLALSALFYRRE
ncbi:MAG TPA: helix-turn-helix domain-containing protein [Chryseolinea sp.]|nr:helix-turn-helix domain-containing protein [Chryseolinea sp.]